MEKNLHPLYDALKKIISRLKPEQNPLSFIIMTGKNRQGKSALLKQGNLDEFLLPNDNLPTIYYNAAGIFLELDEIWLHEQSMLLQQILKQINNAHRGLKITGLVFCVDVHNLALNDPEQWSACKQGHIHFLTRLGKSLGYKINTSIMITKMDALAGFTEFYQSDHISETIKPLGFSLPSPKKENFIQAFNLLLENIEQQVIYKLHPARSDLKRTLIREFPLQLSSLRKPLQSLLQSIPAAFFNVQALYFSSAEQGGSTIDRLNRKIQHEFALMVHDSFPHATNYRPWFIEGALENIQKNASQHPVPVSMMHKAMAPVFIGVGSCILALFGYGYYKTTHTLQQLDSALIIYEKSIKKGDAPSKTISHLVNATNALDGFPGIIPGSSAMHQLKKQLQTLTQKKLVDDFLPTLSNQIEQVLSNPETTAVARYKALKVYLMLGNSQYFESKTVMEWFHETWKKNRLTVSKKEESLLNQIVDHPPSYFSHKAALISDARNYLNALPVQYLYYSLLKDTFPKETLTVHVPGFTLARQNIPIYYTKNGFREISSRIVDFTWQFQKEQWVLAGQDLPTLESMMIEAYSKDYQVFWKQFLKNSKPLRFENTREAREIISLLKNSKAIQEFLHLVQEHTEPDLDTQTPWFNQNISSEFTELNLMGRSSTRELSLSIGELDKYVATLSALGEPGKTAFHLTKARFTGNHLSDPISQLYHQSAQLPEPVASWTRQLADDVWSMLIRDSRIYINQQWKDTVYRNYQNTILGRYPVDNTQNQEIPLEDFNRFFSSQGQLNRFSETFLKPFLNTSKAQWQPKEVNGYAFPISEQTIQELIRANIITHMFFPNQSETAKIDFSLQKISLDPIIATLQVDVGNQTIKDSQKTESFERFTWPGNRFARLRLTSIDGNNYEIREEGIWAFFRLLEKVNVLADTEDNAALQILFEVNSNSGRYLLKTSNSVNAFAPGVLNGFVLRDVLI